MRLYKNVQDFIRFHETLQPYRRLYETLTNFKQRYTNFWQIIDFYDPFLPEFNQGDIYQILAASGAIRSVLA